MYSIIKDKPYKHFWQIVICVSEIYGGWITFCPEWLTGNKSLNTKNPLYFWVYLWFFNIIWVIIPALLLYQSYYFILNQIENKKKKNLLIKKK